MQANEFFDMALTRAEGALKRALDDLSPEELRAQPAGPGSNPIGWMAWHLTRVQDGVISRLQGVETEWDASGWAARFGIEGEVPQWTPANVHEFDPVDATTLLGYYDAVRARTSAYVGGLTADALAVEQEPFRPGAPPMTVVQMLALVLGDNVQHIGQIAYLRGALKEQGWY